MTAPASRSRHRTGRLTKSKGDLKSAGLFLSGLLLGLGLLVLTATPNPVFVGDTVRGWMLIFGSLGCLGIFLSPRLKKHATGLEPMVLISGASLVRGLLAYFSSDSRFQGPWPWGDSVMFLLSLVAVVCQVRLQRSLVRLQRMMMESPREGGYQDVRFELEDKR